MPVLSNGVLLMCNPSPSSSIQVVQLLPRGEKEQLHSEETTVGSVPVGLHGIDDQETAVCEILMQVQFSVPFNYNLECDFMVGGPVQGVRHTCNLGRCDFSWQVQLET